MTLEESIDYKLGSIEAKLDQLMLQLPALETRVASLETFRWRIAGVFSVVSAIAGSAVTWLLHGRK